METTVLMPTVAATSTASRSQRGRRWPDRAIYSAFGSTGCRVVGLVESSPDQITDELNDCDFKSSGKKLSCKIVPDPWALAGRGAGRDELHAAQQTRECFEDPSVVYAPGTGFQKPS